jgi:hypothetical protein
VAGKLGYFVVNEVFVASELARAGLRSSPKTVTPIHQEKCAALIGTASRSSASKLARHRGSGPVRKVVCLPC